MVSTTDPLRIGDTSPVAKYKDLENQVKPTTEPANKAARTAVGVLSKARTVATRNLLRLINPVSFEHTANVHKTALLQVA